ncbi:MAG: 3-deoxy-D-manno-octulosonic acid transferase [Thiotrichales bacterium]|nr:MAG: 3-deoxy-D-manno-octulosonic acid transferase [Thiotrichales bacterium]
MYFLYNLLGCALLPFVFIRLLAKSIRAPAYRKNWQERLGMNNLKETGYIWVHAVSLGESIAATKFIKEILKNTEHPILITNTTPTGRQYICSAFGDNARVSNCYLPYDITFIVKKFIKKIHPKLLILIETELWPNLIKESRNQKIPVALVNARLSARSANKYAKFGKYTKNMFQMIDFIATQFEADAKRFISLGADTNKVQTIGNLKLDVSLQSDLLKKITSQKKHFGKRPIWIASSTHHPEETMILEVHKTILKTIPNALLILVPRHPERFNEIYKLCDTKGFDTIRRSNQEGLTKNTQVFLVDSIGELMQFYGIANIAFVGGSLIPRGGHNILEPASCGIPCIFGPHMFNFSKLAEMLIAADIGYQIQNSKQLQTKLLEIFANKRIATLTKSKATKFFKPHKNIASRLAALLKETFLRD